MCILQRGLQNVVCSRYIKDIKQRQRKYMRKAHQKLKWDSMEIMRFIQNIYYVEMGDRRNFKEEKMNTLD